MSKKETKKKAEISDDTIINEAATETVIELSAEEQLSVDLAEEKDKFLRLFAEFENYKRRTTKERIELFSTASQDVIKSLLPVVDDFDRALLEMSKSKVSAFVFVINLFDLGGSDNLVKNNYNVENLIDFPGH